MADLDPWNGKGDRGHGFRGVGLGVTNLLQRSASHSNPFLKKSNIRSMIKIALHLQDTNCGELLHKKTKVGVVVSSCPFIPRTWTEDALGQGSAQEVESVHLFKPVCISPRFSKLNAISPLLQTTVAVMMHDRGLIARRQGVTPNSKNLLRLEIEGQ